MIGALPALAIALVIAAAPAAPARLTPAELLEKAHEARLYEDAGAYTRAAGALEALEKQLGTDTDFQVALALDEARAGMLDKAATRLMSPQLEKALGDTLPYQRRTTYPWEREKLWVNGNYDGWHWYIARARAEVMAKLGRWPEAHAAARLAVLARPMVGREWLILAVCAGRVGRFDEARECARVAAAIDPTLPEAFYVYGVHAWRESRRSEAAEAFRFATEIDSTWARPALALVRLSLPSSRPDTLPATLLHGPREAGLITSPERPKLEEFFQTDFQPQVSHRVLPTMPAEARAAVKTGDLALPVLVDQRGRIVLHELPWYEVSRMPTAAMTPMLASLNYWRFKPATRNGQPVAVWVNLPLQFQGGGSSP